MALVFDGIKRVESVGGGILKIRWNAATGGTVESYNIYIRNGDSAIFSAPYLLRKVRSTILSAFVRVEADGTTFLRNDNTYHLGVKAKEVGGTEDTNTTIKTSEPVGDGSLPNEAPDRKIAIFT